MSARAAFRLMRTGLLAAGLALPLAGCETFDLVNLIPDSKKKLPGERREVFPEGVPGVSKGVPPELIKGYQAPPEDTAAATPPPAQSPNRNRPPGRNPSRNRNRRRASRRNISSKARRNRRGNGPRSKSRRSNRPGRRRRNPAHSRADFFVMPGLVPGIHVFLC